MANIKDLKKKIKSTKNTLKITSAMKLVSAAKLSRAQSNIVNSRPYSEEVFKMIKVASALATDYKHDYFYPHTDSGKSLLLVISANKGLCGNYNGQLGKKVKAFVQEIGSENLKVEFIGKKVKELVEKEVNAGELYKFETAEPTFADIQELAAKYSELFCGGEYQNIYVAYNKFNSAISFDSTVSKVLPIELAEAEKQELAKEFAFDFKYEPNVDEILDKLVPEAFTSTIYTSLLDALASEHGSRMAAMDNATRNCKEAIKKLTLYMNKLRQAAITTELIEVVSGAESLKG
jgi:F-type H+-transporting ATPase subunit gamma